MTTQEESKLLKDVDEMHRALVGDVQFAQPGLIRDVESLKTWRRNIDLRIAMMSGGVFTIGIFLRWLFTGKP